MVELIDLSGYVESGQPVYPGWQETEIFTATTHEEFGYMGSRAVEEETASTKRHLKAQRSGDNEKTPLVRNILISEHGPTHVDALSHLDPTNDGTIDEMSLERFYGPAICVDVSHVSHEEFIEREDIEDELETHSLEIEDGDHILLYTGHREENYAVDDEEKKYAYLYEYTGLSEKAAYWLGEQGVSNIGIDAPSIDRADAVESKEWPAHDMCAEYEVLNMENMANLDEVVGERFTLNAIPLKLREGTGSPIRPVAILE